MQVYIGSYDTEILYICMGIYMYICIEIRLYVWDLLENNLIEEWMG